MKKVSFHYEVTEQVMRGYLIFFFGSLLPIVANYFLMFVLIPQFLLLPIFRMLAMRVMIVLNIVSVISLFCGIYFLIMEGLLTGIYSEVKWILLMSICIILVGIGWTLFFWNLSLTPLEQVMGMWIFAMNYREGVVGLGIIQIILGVCFLGRSILVYRGVASK